jgi:hypothetical protein
MQVLAFAATFLASWLARAVNRPALHPRNAAALTVLVLAFAAATHPTESRADHVVYSPLVEEGEKATELRGHYDFDDKKALDGGQACQGGIRVGATAWWLAELLVKYEREPGESLDATEIASENIFQFTYSGKYWADFGMLAEFVRAAKWRQCLEVALLHQKEFGRNEVRVNFVFEQEFERRGPRDGVPLAVSLPAGRTLRAWHRNASAVPARGRSRSSLHHEQQLGPAMFGKFRTADGATGINWAAVRLTDETPDATVSFPRVRILIRPRDRMTGQRREALAPPRSAAADQIASQMNIYSALLSPAKRPSIVVAVGAIELRVTRVLKAEARVQPWLSDRGELATAPSRPRGHIPCCSDRRSLPSTDRRIQGCIFDPSRRTGRWKHISSVVCVLRVQLHFVQCLVPSRGFAES